MLFSLHRTNQKSIHCDGENLRKLDVSLEVLLNIVFGETERLETNCLPAYRVITKHYLYEVKKTTDEHSFQKEPGYKRNKL